MQNPPKLRLPDFYFSEKPEQARLFSKIKTRLAGRVLCMFVTWPGAEPPEQVAIFQ